MSDIEKEILTFDVSDEALEIAAGEVSDKANFTLGACTGLSECPGWSCIHLQRETAARRLLLALSALPKSFSGGKADIAAALMQEGKVVNMVLAVVA